MLFGAFDGSIAWGFAGILFGAAALVIAMTVAFLMFQYSSSVGGWISSAWSFVKRLLVK